MTYCFKIDIEAIEAMQEVSHGDADGTISYFYSLTVTTCARRTPDRGR